MAFQQTIFINQAAGVPGEIIQDVPWIVQPYTLVSTPELNTVGATAYTITSQGIAQAGSGGAFGFAGILGIPKSYALNGTGGVPLAPTLVLPDQTVGEIVSQGMMFVTLPAAAAIGDYVVYDNTTGVLATMSPGPTLPSGYSFANAVVAVDTVSAAGLAIIQLSVVVNPVPVPA